MKARHRPPASRFLLLALAALVSLSASVACGPARDPLRGTYIVKGGGAPLDVFNPLSREFIKRHPGVNFVFDDVGSRSGMGLVANGLVDLGTSSAEPSADQRDQVKLVSLGVSGTAVVVNAGNSLSGLSQEQVRGIFSGTVTDWAAVGGTPGRILVATRNPTSAIRTNFEAYFFGGKPASYPKDMFELGDIEETIRAVASLRQVVSIITINDRSLGESRVRLVMIDGVQPSKENLVSGAYPVRRPLYLVYNPTYLKPAIQAFLDFVNSPDGQRLIAAAGAS